MVILVIPAGPHADLEASTAHRVDGRRHLRKGAGNSERDRRDERADPDRARVARQPGERRPRIGRRLADAPGRRRSGPSGRTPRARQPPLPGEGQDVVVAQPLLRLRHQGVAHPAEDTCSASRPRPCRPHEARPAPCPRQSRAASGTPPGAGRSRVDWHGPPPQVACQRRGCALGLAPRNRPASPRQSSPRSASITSRGTRAGAARPRRAPSGRAGPAARPTSARRRRRRRGQAPRGGSGWLRSPRRSPLRGAGAARPRERERGRVPRKWAAS